MSNVVICIGKINFQFLLMMLFSGSVFPLYSANPNQMGPILIKSGVTMPFLAPSGLLCDLLSHPELSKITNPMPAFGWIVNSDKTGDLQVAYQIMVASSPES